MAVQRQVSPPSTNPLVSWKRQKRLERMRLGQGGDDDATLSDRISELLSFRLLAVVGVVILLAIGVNVVLLLTREPPVSAARRPAAAAGGGGAAETVALEEPSKGKGKAPASGPPASTPGSSVPGGQSVRPTRDFFSELCLEFEEGDSHIDLDVESPDERILFESWKRSATGAGKLQGLSLERREKTSDGTESYKLSVEGQQAHGLLRVRPASGRWSIVSIEPSGDSADREAEKAEALKELDLMKKEPAGDSRP